MISWSRHGYEKASYCISHDRPPPGHAEPDGGAEQAGLGQRRVEAALRPEAVAQAGGRAEDAARATDVLAEHHHVLVARELAYGARR